MRRLAVAFQRRGSTTLAPERHAPSGAAAASPALTGLLEKSIPHAVCVRGNPSGLESATEWPERNEKSGAVNAPQRGSADKYGGSFTPRPRSCQPFSSGASDAGREGRL